MINRRNLVAGLTGLATGLIPSVVKSQPLIHGEPRKLGQSLVGEVEVELIVWLNFPGKLLYMESLYAGFLTNNIEKEIIRQIREYKIKQKSQTGYIKFKTFGIQTENKRQTIITSSNITILEG